MKATSGVVELEMSRDYYLYSSRSQDLVRVVVKYSIIKLEVSFLMLTGSC